MKRSVLLYFLTRLSCRLLIACLWSKASCWLAAAALWFACPVAEPVLLGAGESEEPIFREQRAGCKWSANIPLIGHSVGGKTQVFQRMLRDGTFPAQFSA